MGTKTIDTLVEDIEKLFIEEHTFDAGRVEAFGQKLAKAIAYHINRPKETSGGFLRFSNIGQKCNRKLWYSVNTPSDGEQLPFEARVKFLFGHILEELLLFFAAEAGHEVSGEQDELEISGVKGHRDGLIDGVVVDCKSASSYSFKKFKEGLKYEDDSFGYIDQLQAYLHASQSDPIVTDKSRAAFLVIDKTLGHITLDVHNFHDKDFLSLVEEKKAAVSSKEPPKRFYKDIPEGKSGNRKLCMECSYCPFKTKCFPGLRTFVYSTGPRFLTHVEREPDVAEVNRKNMF